MAALSKFDPAQAKFETFVARVVEHKVATIVEARQASCRDYRRCRCSLNDPLKAEEGKRPVERGDVLDQDAAHPRTGGANRPHEEHVNLRQDIRTILAGLPPEWRRLCRRLMKETPSEVERKTGTARGTLYESIQKVRRRFEKDRLREYL